MAKAELIAANQSVWVLSKNLSEEHDNFKQKSGKKYTSLAQKKELKYFKYKQHQMCK